MSWIDDGLEKQKQIADRKNLIFQEAEITFNQLWQEIFRCVKEAEQKGIKVYTNGSSLERVVSMPVQPRPGQTHTSPKTLRISLPQERTTINASGPGINVTLSFDICDGNVVCLKGDGKRIELADAARKILEPFFFPQVES
jgi:hypothetical protein